MSNIQVIKVGNTINLSINGKLQKKTCKNSKESDELYKACITANENPTEENIKRIKVLLNEKTRIAYLTGLECDVDTGEVFLEGFNTPIPKTLLDVFEEYHENNYPVTAITNFWKLLMINPDKRIRESLFKFITTHDFVLTDMGYMVVYKAVYLADKNQNNEVLNNFVVNKFNQVKKDWKCSANKYVVYLDNETNMYSLTKEITANKWNEEELNIKFIGNLGELYKNLSVDGKTIYTDMRTRKFSIELGVPVKMLRTECNSDPEIDCSYGLHVGATKYVNTFANENSVVLVCLVNPAHVVAVPNYDHSKMRVSEYYPYAVAEYSNNKIGAIKEVYFENDYSNFEQKELEEMIANVKANDVPIQTAKMAEIESRSMEELMKMLESRLVDITK